MDGSEKGTRCRSGEARRQEHGAGVPGEADDVVSRQQDADVADLPVEEEERGEDGDKRPLAHAAQLAMRGPLAPPLHVKTVGHHSAPKEQREGADLRREAERAAPARRAVCKVPFHLLSKVTLEVRPQPKHKAYIGGNKSRRQRGTAMIDG